MPLGRALLVAAAVVAPFAASEAAAATIGRSDLNISSGVERICERWMKAARDDAGSCAALLTAPPRSSALEVGCAPSPPKAAGGTVSYNVPFIVAALGMHPSSRTRAAGAASSAAAVQAAPQRSRGMFTAFYRRMVGGDEDGDACALQLLGPAAVVRHLHETAFLLTCDCLYPCADEGCSVDGDAESHCGDEQGEEGEEGLEDFPHSSSDRAGRTPIGPDRARVEQTGREVQADKDAMRPANTRKAYGKNDYSAGPKREFFQFCAAVAGEHVNGVQMDAGKISYISSVVLNPEVDPLVDDQDISLQAFVTPETVDEYFTKYLVKRGQLTSGRGRARKKREDEGDDELVDDPLYMPQPKANTHVNRGTVEQHRKALMDLWKAQKRGSCDLVFKFHYHHHHYHNQPPVVTAIRDH